MTAPFQTGPHAALGPSPTFPLSPQELSSWIRFGRRGGIGKGIALEDVMAESSDDLMFLQEDEVVYLFLLQSSPIHSGQDLYLVSSPTSESHSAMIGRGKLRHFFLESASGVFRGCCGKVHLCQRPHERTSQATCPFSSFDQGGEYCLSNLTCRRYQDLGSVCDTRSEYQCTSSSRQRSNSTYR